MILAEDLRNFTDGATHNELECTRLSVDVMHDLFYARHPAQRVPCPPHPAALGGSSYGLLPGLHAYSRGELPLVFRPHWFSLADTGR